jgi:hypothetical protein
MGDMRDPCVGFPSEAEHVQPKWSGTQAARILVHETEKNIQL